MVDVFEPQGITPSDIVAPPERAVIHPFNYYAASSAGGRTNNQDAYFCPASMYLPTLNNKNHPLSETAAQLSPDIKQQLEETVGLLDGFKYTDSKGEEITLHYDLETILNLAQQAQKAIGDGKLNGLAIVADGMQKYGDLASSIDTILVTDKILQLVESTDTASVANTSLKLNDLKAIIADADRIMASLRVQKGYDFHTTLALVVTDNQDHTYFASVGDSRIYKRNRQTGDVDLLTKDESAYWGLLNRFPETLPSDFFTLPHMNIVPYPVGSGKVVPDKIQVAEMSLTQDDQLILCTDGVWSAVDTKDQDTMRILNRIDRQYLQDLGSRKDFSRAVRKAYSSIMQLITLKDLTSENSHGQNLIDHLIRDKAGQLSRDNTTAVLNEKQF